MTFFLILYLGHFFKKVINFNANAGQGHTGHILIIYVYRLFRMIFSNSYQ